jgi:DNA-directed RNA polymerase specialized sigma24 family protein
MIDGLSPREFQRRSRLALSRMTPLQRQIFRDLSLEDASYPEVATRHGITEPEVRAAFTSALLILAAAYDDPPPWWRRLWPW